MADCSKLDREYLHITTPFDAASEGEGHHRRKARARALAATSDNELSLVQHTVTNWLGSVDSQSSFASLLNDFKSCQGAGNTPKTLDLIGHSTGAECFLQLGAWLIDSNAIAAFAELKPIIEQLGIMSIRLLGCTTAYTDKACTMIQNLSDTLGIPVCGTHDLLTVDFFDKNGLIERRQATECASATRKLIARAGEGQAAPPDFPEDAHPVRQFDLDMVPPFPPVELDKIPGVTWPLRHFHDPMSDSKRQSIYEALGDSNRANGRSLPGLLLKPQLEYRIPVAADRHRILQVLFNGHLLRAYSPTLQVQETVGPPGAATLYPVTNPYTSAVYRVANPDLLLDALDTKNLP